MSNEEIFNLIQIKLTTERPGWIYRVARRFGWKWGWSNGLTFLEYWYLKRIARKLGVIK